MDESLRADRSRTGDEQLCRVEQCNGAGDCRKSQLIGGTMCPAYKVSRDELQTTRARANILREYLQSPITNHQSPITNSDLKSVLSSCLACKACKKECPSGVDMTRLRTEALQALYDQEGTPLRTWMVAHNADVQRLGAIMPSVYNWFASNRLTSSLLKKIMGFAPERRIPEIHRTSIVHGTSLNSTSKKVFLFLDEFTRYNEPELVQTFIDLLSRLGYNVIIPKHVESGRAAISKGCLRLAKKYADKNVRLLKDLVTEDTPLVGIEPSCILTFRDEYPYLVAPELQAAAENLGRNALLFDEFLMREVHAGRITSDRFSDMQVEIWLHGHCHQKALVGVEQTAELLRLPANAIVHVIPSGCCGMAGSFGYEKAHYQTSIAIGEMVLFPTVRKANSQQLTANSQQVTLIAAPGISCRTQIKDGTGITAHHPIEILNRLLK
jgi:Fe-S oxidoreductase